MHINLIVNTSTTLTLIEQIGRRYKKIIMMD